MTQQSVLRRIFVNSGWLLGGQASVAGLSFLQSVLLAQGLGLEGFGLYSLLVAVSAAVTQLCSSRIFETVIRYVTSLREDGEVDRAAATLQVCYRLQLATATVAASLLYFGATLLTDWFLEGHPSGPPLVAWMALAPLLAFANECNSAVLRLANRYRTISAQQAGVALLKTAAIAVLWWRGMALAHIVAVHLAVELVGALALMALGRAATAVLELPRRRYAWRDKLRELRNVIGFTFFTNLAGTSRLVTSRGDLLALGFFAGPEAAAVFALARRLTDRMMSLADPLVVAVFPEVSTLVARRRFGELNTLLGRLTRKIGMWVVPSCLLAAVVAELAVVPLFGEEFHASALLIQIMVWRAIWLPLSWFNSYLLSLGRARLAASLTWGDAAAFLLFLAVLVPTQEALGAAIATVLRCVLWVLIVTAVHRRFRAALPRVDVERRDVEQREAH